MLQAGVQPRNETATSTTLTSFGIGVAGRAEFSAIGVNGGRALPTTFNWMVCPSWAAASTKRRSCLILEGLQEVRVTSNDFTAEYGHGQSVIALTTKSGTNQYHGEANYMIRNEALNANTYSNNTLALPRTVFKLNQLGGATAAIPPMPSPSLRRWRRAGARPNCST
jgi:hypothetical protein